MDSPLHHLKYIHEKFRCAVEILATGEKDARSRVKSVYSVLWAINHKDSPKSVINKVEKIDKLLTRLPGREGHLVEDNLRKMKNSTASKVALLIFEVYLDIVGYIKELESNQNGVHF
ncbi:MAG: hypothetical protein WC121_05355 [Candidatus Kapaibacterium sp.]